MTDVEMLRGLAEHYNLPLGAKLAIAGACDEIERLRAAKRRVLPPSIVDDPVAVICKVLCKSRIFETGQGTCALICMDQLGDARKRGCYHAQRVHDKLALSILEALSDTKQPEGE